MKKNRAILIRISEYDLEKLKERANRDALPYQTLLTSIIHKYNEGRLVEK